MKDVNPTKDGIDHINVSKDGKTELGRWMAGFDVPVLFPTEPHNPRKLRENFIRDLMCKVKVDKVMYKALQESSLRLWSYRVTDAGVVDFLQAERWTVVRAELWLDDDCLGDSEQPDIGCHRNPFMEELDPNFKKQEMPSFIKNMKEGY